MKLLTALVAIPLACLLAATPPCPVRSGCCTDVPVAIRIRAAGSGPAHVTYRPDPGEPSSDVAVLFLERRDASAPCSVADAVLDPLPTGGELCARLAADGDRDEQRACVTLACDHGRWTPRRVTLDLE